MTTESGKIFNVQEPTGAEAAKLQTTAANAQLEAGSTTAARQVEKTADETAHVAESAATAAKSLGPGLTGDTDATSKLQQEAGAKTNAAVAEGKQNVDAAKQAGAGYVDAAKGYANAAVAAAQNYIPESMGGSAPTLQAGAQAATADAKKVLAAAQQQAQPALDKARELTAQGFGSQAAAAAGTTTDPTPASSTGIPATSAPLQSGAHVLDTPYPPGDVAKGGEVASK
ncbi:hypothetical protein BD626DRAFT_486081 [Schizophyllum amplum]|uniref:Uncharacterized protein n=1 Tax=Schizophyllum amplum TaxID=97359 RepID=A0A550CM71_9AGAR|nr:hypothetical protein BD626DRAFT_486081 [Auriculariopsis ampla]